MLGGALHGVGGPKVGGAIVHSGRRTWSGRPVPRSQGRTPVSGGPRWVAMDLREERRGQILEWAQPWGETEAPEAEACHMAFKPRQTSLFPEIFKTYCV